MTHTLYDILVVADAIEIDGVNDGRTLILDRGAIAMMVIPMDAVAATELCASCR